MRVCEGGRSGSNSKSMFYQHLLKRIQISIQEQLLMSIVNHSTAAVG